MLSLALGACAPAVAKPATAAIKSVDLDIGTDNGGMLLTDYQSGRLVGVTISIGLSNSRVDWTFSLKDGKPVRFSAARRFFAYDERRQEFDMTRTGKELRVNYVRKGGKFALAGKTAQGDEYHDSHWTSGEIEGLFALISDYLDSGDQRKFEQALEKFIKG